MGLKDIGLEGINYRNQGFKIETWNFGFNSTPFEKDPISKGATKTEIRIGLTSRGHPR